MEIGHVYDWTKGQRVVRNLAGIEIPGTIEAIIDGIAYFRPDDPICRNWPLSELWPFDACGWEYDQEMRWGYRWGLCISYIRPERTN